MPDPQSLPCDMPDLAFFGCLELAAAAYLDSCLAQAIGVPVWLPYLDEWQPLRQPTDFASINDVGSKGSEYPF